MALAPNCSDTEIGENERQQVALYRPHGDAHMYTKLMSPIIVLEVISNERQIIFFFFVSFFFLPSLRLCVLL